MSDLAAPHILALTAYEPGKPEDELRRELGLDDIVKLASNENPYGPSPKAIEALRTADLQLERYPDPRGYALREALAAHHEVRPEQVCLGNGSNELIDLICRVVASRGEHAVFGHPSFPCYRIGSVAQELRFTAVPLRDDLNWNVDDLLDAVTPDTKLVFVSNPNNPTGSYIARRELERLLHSLPERVLAVIDEAYVEYADARDFAPATDLRDMRERLAILRTFSKAYALAALRVGYLLGPRGLVFDLNRLRAPFNVGTLGQVAATAALGDQAHLRASVEATLHDRRALVEALEGAGLRVAPSQANFILVEVPKPGRAVYEDLLRHGVIVRAMGPPLQSWIRVTVGRPAENERFLQALVHVLREARV
ncbi:MAG: histidinol-phosphate transaminase [Deltaproteobacteria bacterium]|nr:histidinol-phosphate transaminase [Deltaproteobacteria bacterium]NND30293.1 histidinol-phosphate transaminase [Myxococcales bacterium]MBT8463777.1 histidinol-phosphate transaminase [Deltaproteobacteria bacterium]MBT8483146.1 histidinol-phosphate transaminase [Deltaproteobacteria bacterium]NNK07254.1 histidinol-phosphate transaminase [Myxococcales bacterium]